ncbi:MULTISPECIES: cytochrome c3 family protein [unclassified Coleofasciculus]|uniref:cytochrome c3 family protein n=1 Tax=unclassified Coleofasciculus TaxID=2692782 RepID=UPI001882CD18|nr:cytochrome c3 family protein [Coleofasciculus sp. LEGE 07092]MBE9128652.1 cytochrome c3 family protein [Coleofasciculus sp. LEGE 07081]MBE9149753.1 cytochrome c3 family protein [Coleofasciculus sp. LEGE 07092]
MRKMVVLVMVLLGFFVLGDVRAMAENLSQAELDKINPLWQESAHALAEINCSSCHQDAQTKAFIAQPTYESCQSCHEQEVETFLLGKHGIRLGEGMTPLTPGMAHLPMKASATGKQMNCNTCHDVHSVNTLQASVDSCLSCHNDRHSLNYKQSKHAQLFAAQGSLPRPTAESVTCATCHLPRQERGSTVFVNHNNTFTLLPRDRMVKEVCMNCHGMEYSYNSIFDDELVEADFSEPPTQQLESLDMIRALKQKRK